MGAWSQTVSGRALDFAAPEVTREHLFGEVAHGLALVNRFSGQTQVPYSVAQHCVLGAEAILRESDDVELAAFFLLHDAHEAWFGDLPRPALAAIGDAIADDAIEAGVPAHIAAVFAGRLRRGVKRVKRALDRAVIAAAGLRFASFEVRSEEIATADIRMLRTERDQLLGPAPLPWEGGVETVAPFVLRPARLKCWAWPEAEERYRDALARLCPLQSAAPARDGASQDAFPETRP